MPLYMPKGLHPPTQATNIEEVAAFSSHEGGWSAGEKGE